MTLVTQLISTQALYSHHGRSHPDQLDNVAPVVDWHLRRIQDEDTGVQNAALKLQRVHFN